MKNSKKAVAILAVIIGIGFLVAGVVYATHSASTLPHFYPGYEAGSSHVHTKHAIASFLLGLAALIFAWFQSGTKPTATTTPPTV